MQKDTIAKISSSLQCKKVREGIHKKLENDFFTNWKQQKPILLIRKPPNKRKTEKNFKKFSKESDRKLKT